MSIYGDVRHHSLDGLRGILCCIVVIHHFRCGFFPCAVFGPNAEWVTNPREVCDEDTSQPYFVPLLYPFVNGTFAVAVFFVMSGFVLSQRLLFRDSIELTSGDSDTRISFHQRMKLAAAKRFFRLLFPVAAALVFADVLGFFRFHISAAELSHSRWMLLYGPLKPSFPLGLFQQILSGVWQGTCTLNNSIWTMQWELFGSFLVFGLVAVLRESKYKKMILGALCFYLVLPSSYIFSSVEMHFTYEDNQVVIVNPIKHDYILEQILNTIDETTNFSILDKSYTSNKSNPNVQVLDSPKYGLTNFDLLEKLASKTQKTQSLVRTKNRKSATKFVWYAAFVAGVWLADNDNDNRDHSLMTMKPTPKWKTYTLIVIVFFSATLPLMQGSLTVQSTWIQNIRNVLGPESVNVWYMIGATCLVHIILQAQPKFLTSNICMRLGRLSYSLYLVHIPIIFSVTSYLYANGYSKWISCSISFPVMLLAAEIFYRWVDEPSVRYSKVVGELLLSMI